MFGFGHPSLDPVVMVGRVLGFGHPNQCVLVLVGCVRPWMHNTRVCDDVRVSDSLMTP